jgi:hypothetical protein
MSFDFSDWTEDDRAKAKKMQDVGQILSEVRSRSVLFDTPNTFRPDLENGNRKERRRSRALNRRKQSDSVR